MPCKAMQKFNTRNGGRFSWGWKPPTDATVAAFMRLLGASVVGDAGALGRINVVATALSARMRVEDFAEIDMGYAPPYATAMDPLMVAAQQLAKLVD